MSSSTSAASSRRPPRKTPPTRSTTWCEACSAGSTATMTVRRPSPPSLASSSSRFDAGRSRRPARYNPFAFPSDIDFAFWLLVAVILGTSLLVYLAVANSVAAGFEPQAALNARCEGRAGRVPGVRERQASAPGLGGGRHGGPLGRRGGHLPADSGLEDPAWQPGAADRGRGAGDRRGAADDLPDGRGGAASDVRLEPTEHGLRRRRVRAAQAALRGPERRSLDKALDRPGRVQSGRPARARAPAERRRRQGLFDSGDLVVVRDHRAAAVRTGDPLERPGGHSPQGLQPRDARPRRVPPPQ